MVRRPKRSAIETDERGPDKESGEHGCDESCDAGGTEEAGSGGREDAGADQAGRDVAGEEEVVKFEEPAEGDEGDAQPDAFHLLTHSAL